MKIRRDFCIVFCICSRKECDNVQESDLQRASKILRTAFGSDWKQIVQTLGTRELTHCVGQDLTSFMAFPERAEGGSNQWRGNCSPQVIAKLIQFVKNAGDMKRIRIFIFGSHEWFWDQSRCGRGIAYSLCLIRFKPTSAKGDWKLECIKG